MHLKVIGILLDWGLGVGQDAFKKGRHIIRPACYQGEGKRNKK